MIAPSPLASLLASLSLLAAAIAPAPARASLAVPASVEDLARGSDAVVRGRVVGLTGRWSADGRRISTYAEVEPSGVWRGSAPARVTVVVPGGVVGDLGQRVEGAPRFSLGEEVVLFLGKTDGRLFRVQGLGQGKFSLSDGQARPDVSGFQFVEGPALRAGERRAEAMAIEELERRVRTVR